MKKTKIVCTIGPASENVETLKEMILAGMNVARINFSHGGIEEQQTKIDNVKKAREELQVPVALMLDTKGPEIRTGKLQSSPVILNEGESIILTNQDIIGNEKKVSISYKQLYKEVKIGSRILIDDGSIEIEVEKIEGVGIFCKSLHGGELGNRKSINLPGISINLPTLTEKDINDITAGIREGFDYIAASFVRRADDVNEIRKLLKENGGEHIKIISKIENREGIDNFDEILNVSDGIMVARGDLSVEVPMEEVPILQKQFIKKCYYAGKPVITATQMLESMIENPRPTRAEVSDVANSVFDVTGAIMLSAETAMGKYPVECVKTMNKIATTIEKSIKYWKRFRNRIYEVESCRNYEFNINHSICATAMDMDAKAIFAYTEKGDTPRILSGFSPACTIYAVTYNEITYRQLALSWGVCPMLLEKEEVIGSMLQTGIDKKKNEGELQAGDTIVIAGGGTVISNAEETSPINRMIGGVIKI